MHILSSLSSHLHTIISLEIPFPKNPELGYEIRCPETPTELPIQSIHTNTCQGRENRSKQVPTVPASKLVQAVAAAWLNSTDIPLIFF